MKKLLTILLIVLTTSAFTQKEKKYTVSDYITKKVGYPSKKYDCKPTDRMFMAYTVDSTNTIHITYIETTNTKIVPYFVDKLQSTKFIREESDSCGIIITFKKQ